MTRRSLSLAVNPSGDLFSLLIRAVAPYATVVGMVVRSDKVRLSAKARLILDSLEPFLVDASQTDTWPGTKLLAGRTSKVYHYRLAPHVLEILLSQSSSLYEWVNPAMPEDLHFLRDDGSPVLGNVAQEEDSWLELDEDEFGIFSQEAPARLRASLREQSDD
jgi:hypothetical protein